MKNDLSVKLASVLLGVCLTLPSPVLAENAAQRFKNYQSVIQKTANMTRESQAFTLAQKYGLQILNLTWEDTGRYKGSSVGPNISDMTIQVQQKDPQTGQYYLTAMPVIRYPNFSDKTGDIPMDKFFLLVGNEKGKKLRKVSLKKFLGHLREYLHGPSAWKGKRQSLLSDRDTHVLVSAQACFLPIPKHGTAEFNPVLFNYQSYEKNPAVLTILATREGTSVTVIDNKRDAFQAGRTWGQRLFFNQNGKRASLTGKRMSDFIANTKKGSSGHKGPKENAGLNMVMLIQIPLKQKQPMRFPSAMCEEGVSLDMASCARQKTDVENAVIGHGKVEGPFTEIDHLAIERDPQFPIRVTVQFYKATSNGVVEEKDMKAIAKQIEKVYGEADYVGSLVIGGDTNRPTEYIGDKYEPLGWWDAFWTRHHKNTGQTPQDAKKTLHQLLKNNTEEETAREWGIINQSVEVK